MQYPKNKSLQKITVAGITCTLVLLTGLSGCSSSSSPAASTTTPATVTVSGKISTEANPLPGGEPGVTVQGFYSNTDTTTPDITDADGMFSITVDTTKAVSIQLSKAAYATLNFEKSTITAPINDANEDGYPTEVQVQQVIDLALAASTTPLANKAWFVVDVTDANDNEINNVSIASNPAPDVEVYALCDGTDSGLGVTNDAPCADRPIMYLAYFDAAPGDISVTVGGETQTGPVRMGQITVFDFEQ